MKPEAGAHHIILNHHIEDRPECENCSVQIRDQEECQAWETGDWNIYRAKVEFYSPFHSQHLLPFIGKWKWSEPQIQKGLYVRYVQGSFEYEDYAIFEPSLLSWVSAEKICKDIGYSMLQLKTREETERFHYGYQSFLLKTTESSTHYQFYPKAHFLRAKIKPEVCHQNIFLFIPAVSENYKCCPS